MELVTGQFVLLQKAFSQMRPPGRVRKERLLQAHLSHPTRLPRLDPPHLQIFEEQEILQPHLLVPSSQPILAPFPCSTSHLLLVTKKGSGHPFQCVREGCFPTPPSNPWTPAWGPTIQLHSGTIYKEMASDSTG